ncbi:MAG: peptidylprolyl isomerase, partial [Prevotella sp.]|nr:peptidylprolyl isomerase [Prevotella sp.]
MKKTIAISALLVGLWGAMSSMGPMQPTSPISPAHNDSIASIVDEVIWVVGDEPILKSDVEVTRIQAAMEGMRWNNNPDCAIPEQIAVQKLFLHQAAIDSIEVTESEITQQTEARIDYMVEQIGSREKLEEYRKMSMTQIRQSMHDDLRDQMLIQRMKEHLVKDITVTPAEVRRFFRDLPQDSVPFVPTEVEVQIVTLTPRISTEELNRV